MNFVCNFADSLFNDSLAPLDPLEVFVGLAVAQILILLGRHHLIEELVLASFDLFLVIVLLLEDALQICLRIRLRDQKRQVFVL